MFSQIFQFIRPFLTWVNASYFVGGLLCSLAAVQGVSGEDLRVALLSAVAFFALGIAFDPQPFSNDAPMSEGMMIMPWIAALVATPIAWHFDTIAVAAFFGTSHGSYVGLFLGSILVEISRLRPCRS